MTGSDKKELQSVARRRVLGWLGLAGGGVVLAAAAGPLLWVDKLRPSLHLIRQTKLAMGTYVQITVLDPSRDRGEEAVAKAFEEMSRIERLLTRFEGGSAVGVLNRTGRLDGAPPELLEVFGESDRIFRATGGVFDVTVLPLIQALEASIKTGGGRPDPADLAEASKLVGFEHLQADGNRLSFDRQGMAVTLDGIAKGYIVDRGIAALKGCGVERALINAGGDIRALGGRPDGGWRVAVRDPYDENGYAFSFRLTDRAVATSGLYEVYYDRDKLFGHIARPSKPEIPSDAVSASIIAPTCMAADAMATAVFALGSSAGPTLIDSMKELGTLVIDRDGRKRKVRFDA